MENTQSRKSSKIIEINWKTKQRRPRPPSAAIKSRCRKTEPKNGASAIGIQKKFFFVVVVCVWLSLAESGLVWLSLAESGRVWLSLLSLVSLSEPGLYWVLSNEHWREYWVRSTEYSALSTECCVLSTDYWVLSSEYLVLSIKYWVLSTEYWVLNWVVSTALSTECWVLSIGCWVLSTDYWIWKTEYWTEYYMRAEHWTLSTE